MLAASSFVYGLPNPAEVAGMTGREMLQAMIDRKIPAPPIAQTLNFWIVEVGDGSCVFEGETKLDFLNPLGTIHGGWALTLIDTVTGVAGHTLLPAGVGYATVETKANFTRAIRSDTGRVRAEGSVVTRGRQIISAEGRAPIGGTRARARHLYLDGIRQRQERGRKAGGHVTAAKPKELACGFRVKRVYEAAAKEDGFRVLVDRLWPRGLTKEKARLDLWLKEISPSDTLRHLVHDDPTKWEGFVTAYGRELAQEPAKTAAADLRKRARTQLVTLLYGARNETHNNAVALKAWLQRGK